MTSRFSQSVAGPVRWISVAALACATACASSEPQPGSPPPTSVATAFPARVVLVSVAGMTPRAYRGEAGRAPAMPTTAALARAGAAADAVTTVSPSARYPAHATLVTGERPSRHGIVADRRIGDHGVRRASYSHASLLGAPTLWERASQAKLPVAALGWPTTVGASIPFLIPDLEPSTRGETWFDVIATASSPVLVAQIGAADRANPALANEGPDRDRLLVGLACSLLGAANPPALTLLLLSQTAPIQTGFGPDSDESRAALAGADAEIRRLLDCLTASGRAGDTALVITGDRGVLPVHTLVAPNAVLADAGLLSAKAGSPEFVGGWSALSRSNGGSAFVYARSAEAALEARRALSREAAKTRAFRVVSAEQMLDAGGDPEAWFGLEAEPGFGFGNQIVPPVVQAGARRGVGGYLSGQSGSDAGFVAWGRGVRSGVRIPRMRQTDIAPTIAQLLGLDLGEVDGRSLVGILALPSTKSAPAASKGTDAP